VNCTKRDALEPVGWAVALSGGLFGAPDLAIHRKSLPVLDVATITQKGQERGRRTRSRLEDGWGEGKSAGNLADLVTLHCVDELDREETHRAVWSALRSLPTEQAEVVVLKIWEEMTFAQIGQILDASPSTVVRRCQSSGEGDTDSGVGMSIRRRRIQRRERIGSTQQLCWLPS
jgi:hypothetical protein